MKDYLHERKKMNANIFDDGIVNSVLTYLNMDGLVNDYITEPAKTVCNIFKDLITQPKTILTAVFLAGGVAATDVAVAGDKTYYYNPLNTTYGANDAVNAAQSVYNILTGQKQSYEDYRRQQELQSISSTVANTAAYAAGDNKNVALYTIAARGALTAANSYATRNQRNFNYNGTTYTLDTGNNQITNSSNGQVVGRFDPASGSIIDNSNNQVVAIYNRQTNAVVPVQQNNGYQNNGYGNQRYNQPVQYQQAPSNQNLYYSGMSMIDASLNKANAAYLNNNLKECGKHTKAAAAVAEKLILTGAGQDPRLQQSVQVIYNLDANCSSSVSSNLPN